MNQKPIRNAAVSKFSLVLFTCLMVTSLSSQAQLKKGLGKVKGLTKSETPKAVPKNDPSGLFQNVSDNSSAKYHRKNAVENLEIIEAEFAKEKVDFELVKAAKKKVDKSLESVKKLEPNVDAKKFNDRYEPLVAKMDKLYGGSSSLGKADPNAKTVAESGELFANTTDDFTAGYMRRTVTQYLTNLETELNKPDPNTEKAVQYVGKIDDLLKKVKEGEPNVDATVFMSVYNPMKNRVNGGGGAITKLKSLDAEFQSKFRVSDKYQEPNPLDFGKGADYTGFVLGYCSAPFSSEKYTHAEYTTKKVEYDKLVTEVGQYSAPETEKIFKNMNTCLDNGNKYAVWASSTNLKEAIVDFNTANTTARPKMVIERCEEYLNALDRIEKDYSLNLSAEAKTSITNARKQITEVTKKNQEYISSGKYQVYLDKVHKEQIAKIFVPKASTSRPSLESAVAQNVKGREVYGMTVSQVFKTVSMSSNFVIEKNFLDLPKYKYYRYYLSVKTTDGKCLLISVYEQYEYAGGGTYLKKPDYKIGGVEEMSCKNVNITK